MENGKNLHLIIKVRNGFRSPPPPPLSLKNVKDVLITVCQMRNVLMFLYCF